MILNELAQVLASAGVGYSAVGTDIFKGIIPDTPDSCLSIFEYQGAGTEKAMQAGAGGAVVEMPRIQIICRGTARDYSTPRGNASGVIGALDGLGGGVTSCLWIDALTSPFLLERDSNERVLIGINFEVTKRL